jgi:hypothetical protein
MKGLDSFRESKRNAERVSIENVEILILSYSDLIKNKLAVNRENDRSDIDELNKLNNPENDPSLD